MDEQSLNELLECSVCLERLDGTSKVLPCQHTFCRRCLDEIFSTKHELRCPECRTLVEIRVEELPLNILLVRLLEGIKTKQVTERTYSPDSGKQEILQSTAHGSRSSRQSPSNSHACAKALYNYEGKDQGDLSFRKGDMILLRKKVDENWFHGELGNQHGFFPASYVQVVIPLPVTTPQCKALFDFEVNDSEKDCLAFKKEEYLTVIKRVDDNWVEGKKGEKIGIFPISFVEMNDAAKSLINYKAKVPMHASRTPTNGDRSNGERVPAAPPPGFNKNTSQRVAPIPKQKRHSFHASSRHRSHSSHEQRHRRSLDISSNIAGNLIIPGSTPRSMSPPPLPIYNQESHEGAAAGKSSSSNSSTQDVKVAGADGTSSNTQKGSPHDGLKAPPGINSAIHVALYNYKPTKEDEVELKKGDYYTVSDKCQDGWFRGQCLKSGRTGVFPGNYVQTVRHQSAFRAVGNSNVLNIRAKPQVISAPSTTTAAAPTSSVPPCASTASAAGVTPVSGSPQLDARRSRSPTRNSVTPPRATSSPQPTSSRAKLPSPPSSVIVSTSSSSSPSSVSVLSSSKSSQTTTSSSSVSSRSVTHSSDSRTVPTGANAQVFHSSHKSSSHSSHRLDRSSSAHKSSSSSTAASHQHVPKPGSVGMTNYHSQRSGTSTNHQGPAFLSPELLAMQKSMATSANITPPNVVIGPSGDGPIAALQPSKDKKEKRDKEKISLVKRLTSGKSRKSKSTAVEDAGSAAAAASGAASSLVLENNNTISHVRSGSCPSDTSSLLSVETPLHVKTGSFDSSVAPPQPSKPKRPNPPLREKCRCVVPYPPQSDIELELKIGDIVNVHKKRDDGWYKGTQQRTGKTGLFPGNFVEKCV
ncbi:E3 ubiquitin-protein ligase SH3RF1-like isoform X1 [Mizuhopecten yessoensis]|uniref:RING-type E3 ubiquitin transferase n=1 Tax=Mizuhopecten yessoensis TaxID=6573 RepID=A0A210R0H9_MIZYE|nr:E3 ubiquitin-protein ligase SH3RF1-like isoform X1 [Mizuhopecten yessoensis]OWF54497.1 SH3 domain-containing RING finger protein 3 [Mizuhopecten yessoensis]